MAPGEYAVHLSTLPQNTQHTKDTQPFCLLFPTLSEAEHYATQHIAAHPTLCCRIYDHNGFIGAPIRDLRGPGYRDNTDISPRFRRWAAFLLFFGGLTLFLTDWSVDFRFLWPSMLGTRLLLPGSILLVTEIVLFLNARRRRTAPAGAHP